MCVSKIRTLPRARFQNGTFRAPTFFRCDIIVIESCHALISWGVLWYFVLYMSQIKSKRNKEILQMRDKGFSFGLIGARFSIDKKTAYDIYIREKKRRHKIPKTGVARIRKKRTQKVIPR